MIAGERSGRRHAGGGWPRLRRALLHRAARVEILDRALLWPRGSTAAMRALRYAPRLPPARTEAPETSPDAAAGRLERYFDARTEGPGIWKWRHFLPIYERHLGRFVGRRARLVEIGVYGGGSLEMWRSYLGERSEIIGVDREPACRMHERDGIRIVALEALLPRFRREACTSARTFTGACSRSTPTSTRSQGRCTTWDPPRSRCTGTSPRFTPIRVSS